MLSDSPNGQILAWFNPGGERVKRPSKSKPVTSALLFWKDPAPVRPVCRHLPAAVAATAHQKTGNRTCQQPLKCVDGRANNQASCDPEPAGNAFTFWHSELMQIGALLQSPVFVQGLFVWNRLEEEHELSEGGAALISPRAVWCLHRGSDWKRPVPVIRWTNKNFSCVTKRMRGWLR